MRKAIAAAAISVLTLCGPSLAYADIATPTPTPSLFSQQPPQHGGHDDHRGGPDGGEHHRIDDGHDGTDSLQWMFVGAAVVIALGLAYNAGRRQRKKSAE